MRKYVLMPVLGLGVLLVGFQNCGRANFSSESSSAAGANPSAAGATTSPPTGSTSDLATLLVSADPSTVNKDSSTIVSAIMNKIDAVTYSCTGLGSTAIVASGALSPKQTSFPIKVTQDLTCAFNGTASTLANPIKATLAITVNCGAQVKDAGGICRDFECKSVVQLAANALDIPARTADGVCYAAKIIGGLSSGASTLTTAHDPTLLARSHDAANAGSTQTPYLMGQLQTQFTLRGARVVKLAGGASASAPILVDNFILTGIYPAGSTPVVSKSYRVRGSSDASMIVDGKDTGAVQFGAVALPVEAFTTGGVSSIAPIDITAFATPGPVQQLDVRALDCGNQRALSDIFVLFQ